MDCVEEENEGRDLLRAGTKKRAPSLCERRRAFARREAKCAYDKNATRSFFFSTKTNERVARRRSPACPQRLSFATLPDSPNSPASFPNVFSWPFRVFVPCRSANRASVVTRRRLQAAFFFFASSRCASSASFFHEASFYSARRARASFGESLGARAATAHDAALPTNVRASATFPETTDGTSRAGRVRLRAAPRGSAVRPRPRWQPRWQASSLKNSQSTTS